jgi:hypothetical protein
MIDLIARLSWQRQCQVLRRRVASSLGDRSWADFTTHTHGRHERCSFAVPQLVGRIDAGSGVKTLGNTAATEWFGLSALPHRGDFAYDGWAIDVLEALARPREEAIRIRSVVE